VNLCRRLGYPNEKLCVVVNRWQSGEVLSPSDAEDVLKAEIFFKLPNDYRVASGSLTNGKPISEFEPTSKLAYAYTQLAAKLGGGDHIKTNGAATHQNGTGGGSRLKNLFARKRS
jgi:pilus assembly protein CpaE